MYFLLNDLILDLDPERMNQPLDDDRFAALTIEYIAFLGQEMFAEDAVAHRRNPERAKRLAYLIMLKRPRTNAANFFPTVSGGGPDTVETEFKSINDIVLGAMYQQQMMGQLNASKVDQEVWRRMAA